MSKYGLHMTYLGCDGLREGAVDMVGCNGAWLSGGMAREGSGGSATSKSSSHLVYLGCGGGANWANNYFAARRWEY